MTDAPMTSQEPHRNMFLIFYWPTEIKKRSSLEKARHCTAPLWWEMVLWQALVWTSQMQMRLLVPLMPPAADATVWMRGNADTEHCSSNNTKLVHKAMISDSYQVSQQRSIPIAIVKQTKQKQPCSSSFLNHMKSSTGHMRTLIHDPGVWTDPRNDLQIFDPIAC